MFMLVYRVYNQYDESQILGDYISRAKANEECDKREQADPNFLGMIKLIKKSF